MDFLAIFSMWQFYLVLVIVGFVVSMGYLSVNVRGRRRRRRSRYGSILTSGRTWMLIGVIGFLMVTGAFGLLSISSADGQVVIRSVELTTGPDTHADVLASTATIAESTSSPQMIELRSNTTGISETATHLEVNGTVFTVKRTDTVEAGTCVVKCEVPNKFQDQSAPDGKVYPILEETALEKWECYLNGATSSTVATTSSEKEESSISFVRGEDTGYLGVALEVDTGGFGALDDNGHKDIGLNFCNSDYWTIRIIRED